MKETQVGQKQQFLFDEARRVRSAIHRGSISSKHDAVSSKNLPSACLRVMRVAETGRMLFGVVCSVVRTQRVGWRGGVVLRVAGRLSFIRGRDAYLDSSKREAHVWISKELEHIHTWVPSDWSAYVIISAWARQTDKPHTYIHAYIPWIHKFVTREWDVINTNKIFKISQ